jgi:hypothetical protein
MGQYNRSEGADVAYLKSTEFSREIQAMGGKTGILPMALWERYFSKLRKTVLFELRTFDSEV